MGRQTAYTMKNVAGTVDGQDIIGVWDGDDAVSIEFVEDVGTLLIGADGSAIFSQYAHEGARITLRVQHTSPTHRLLHQRLARQRTPGVRLTGFPLHVIDVDSGEGGSTHAAFIQTAPTDSKGKAATVREWVLVTGSWKPEVPRQQ